MTKEKLAKFLRQNFLGDIGTNWNQVISVSSEEWERAAQAAIDALGREWGKDPAEEEQ